jgi:hypothetical protein
MDWTISDGLAGETVNDIAIDVDGTMWFATNYGLSHFIPQSTPIEKTEPYTDLTLKSVKIYPNPFNSSTNLSFNLPDMMRVNIRIFNMLGKLIYKADQKTFSKGTHNIQWEATDYNGHKLPTGIYFAILSFSEQSITRKLLLVK